MQFYKARHIRSGWLTDYRPIDFVVNLKLVNHAIPIKQNEPVNYRLPPTENMKLRCQYCGFRAQTGFT